MTNQKTSDFIYNPPRINYNEEQAIFLGFSGDRLEKDQEIPAFLKIGNGLKSFTLSYWLNDFNPIAQSPALIEEDKSLYSIQEEPFRPITDLNNRKEQSRAAFLKYLDNLQSAGNEILSFTSEGKLTQTGIAAKSKEIAASFIDNSLSGIFLEFKKNSEFVNKSIEKLLEVPKSPKSIEEYLIDIEVRSVYRNNEDLRRAAINGDISEAHGLAVSRAESSISGFKKDEFEFLLFNLAWQRDVRTAYKLDVLYSINCSLWLLAHRTITELLDFSKFSNSDKESSLNSLGLNWRGQNLINQLDNAKYFIESSLK